MKLFGAEVRNLGVFFSELESTVTKSHELFSPLPMESCPKKTNEPTPRSLGEK